MLSELRLNAVELLLPMPYVVHKRFSVKLPRIALPKRPEKRQPTKLVVIRGPLLDDGAVTHVDDPSLGVHL